MAEGRGQVPQQTRAPLERGVFVRQMRPFRLPDFPPFPATQLRDESHMRVAQKISGGGGARSSSSSREQEQGTCIGAGSAETSPSVFSASVGAL
jgi:hypothetical protein